MTSILLAEDQSLVRQGLKMMIEMDPDFKVTGEAENGAEALELCRRQLFDLAILDIRMPVMNGLEASRVLRREHPDLKILILTTFNDESYALEAMKNHVNGYLLKDGEIDELLQSIHHCLEGGLIIEGQVAAKIMPSLIRGKEEVNEVDESITEREKRLLTLIAQGKNNQEIAEELFLSVGTVKNHITVILDKLELRDRTQLAIYALRHDLEKQSD
ncbi:response regulator [Alkalibacterium olivapovliticus]|uniref:DNA-binding NarL/FixJ family response regulator n=1 Tax=Alkalibacterium olivapovliticus TaxID=99907 RepID=A0A2T0W736_9LACT|nr:response regulator transcription factor [Alkalibacterium olivapovliticus]PRY82521.1 DNA-binding NarL/FixJ family response regulator [Alkalibacterium olivapovliticus]